MNLLACTHTHTHTQTGNLLTSFTAGLGVCLYVLVHLSKGQMQESVKQKPLH